jgi:manganese transport protein
MAGESVMDGFINIKLSNNVKRLITMLPAILIIIIGVNPMQALLFSQVSLSLVLPMAIIPLLLITNKKEVMGIFVNNRMTKIFGIMIALIIIGLNFVLIFTTLKNYVG